MVCSGLDLLPQIQSENIHNKTVASWIFEEENNLIYLPFCSLHLFAHTSLVEDSISGVSYGVQHSAHTGSCSASRRAVASIHYILPILIYLVTVAQIDFAEQCGSRILVYKKSTGLD